MGEGLQDNVIYRNVYDFVTDLLPTGWESDWAWLAYLLAAMAIILLVVNILFTLATWLTYAERRILGRFQSRVGPNRAGPFGLLQPIADAIKMLSKEDIVPRVADRWVFNMAPVVMMAPVFLALAVVPFGPGRVLADLNIGVLYVVAVSGIGVMAVLMAGWASANRYAMFGSMRAVAALLSYEIPVVLALLGVVIIIGSMSLTDIVEGQGLPLLLVQPLGFFVFVTGMSAELNRPPFDLAEAESEIIAGYHTEYSGMKFGAFYLAEYSSLVVASAFIAVLFLQGWRGPLLSSYEWLSYVWLLLKISAIAFVFIWVKATLPRLRIDQILTLAWKFLIPLGLINVMTAAVEKMVWPTPTTAELWIMTGINWGIGVVAIVLFSNILAKRRGVAIQTVRAAPRPIVTEVR